MSRVSMTTRRALTLATTAGALLAAAPGAHAATATLSGDTITYTAAPGESNSLNLSQSGGNVILDDSSAVTITDGGGCPIAVSGNAECPEAGVTKIVVDLGDEDDGTGVDPSMLSALTINGGPGNDYLNGSAQGDVINGGDGQDSLNGYGGADTLNGEGGQDSLDGGAGNDTLNGGAGGDYGNGGDGDDTFNGDDGSDYFYAEPGNDTQNGGGGDDQFYYGPGADAMSGGAGYDYVYFYDASADLSLTQDGAANDGAAGEGDNVGSDIEGLLGGSGNDTIVGGAISNYVDGGDGNDLISGGAGSDNLYGGSGNDVVNGDGGGDSVGGGNGDDVVNGGADGDDLNASSGTDVLNGDDGSDRFQAGGSGDGPDTFNGGAGHDTVSWEYYEQSVVVTIDGLANDGIAGANDNVAADVEGVVGGTADDTLTGSAAANVIEGGPGSDVITIRDASADIATCGDGSDTVIADGLDSIDPVGAGCENVDRAAAGGTGRKLGRIGTVSYRKGVVKLTLTCPLDALAGCSGKATLTSSGLGTVGKADFLIPSASAATVEIRLSKKAQSRLKKAKSKKLKVTMSLTGSDLRGALVPANLTFTVKR